MNYNYDENKSIFFPSRVEFYCLTQEIVIFVTVMIIIITTEPIFSLFHNKVN